MPEFDDEPQGGQPHGGPLFNNDDDEDWDSLDDPDDDAAVHARQLPATRWAATWWPAAGPTD